MLPFISTPGKIFIKNFLKDFTQKITMFENTFFLWGGVKEQCFLATKTLVQIGSEIDFLSVEIKKEGRAEKIF